MIKFREKCLYCDKPLDAKNVRKTYCNDKCRMAYGRQLNYELRDKMALHKIAFEKGKFETTNSELAKDLKESPLAKKIVPLKIERVKSEVETNAPFDYEKLFVAEKYTKYPSKDCPANTYEKRDWNEAKRQSDAEIRLQWLEFQLTNPNNSD